MHIHGQSTSSVKYTDLKEKKIKTWRKPSRDLGLLPEGRASARTSHGMSVDPW